MRGTLHCVKRPYSHLFANRKNVSLRARLETFYRNFATSSSRIKDRKLPGEWKATGKCNDSLLYSQEGEMDTYSRSFVAQNSTLENFWDIFRTIINSLKPRKGEPIMLGDYGAANGERTMKLFDDVIGMIKEKHGRDQQVVIVYNDLPGNNFNDLFKKLHGTTTGTTSYMQHWNGVFPLAVGRSFHEQIMPGNSMDIIFNSHALHYLSTIPCCISSGLTIKDSTVEEHNKFKDVASRDWENFLFHRATELKPGGFLVLAVFALTDEYPEALDNIYKIATILKETWDSLLTNSVISEDEYARATINTYARTIDELRLPFTSNKPLISDLGLKMEIMSIKPAIYLRFNEKHADVFPRSEFEKRLCDGLFSVIHNNIYTALSDTRIDANKMAVMDEFRAQIVCRLRTSKIDSYQFPRADIIIRKMSIC